MDRRGALKGMTAGLAAIGLGLQTSGAAASTGETPGTGWDLIVIGGGFAGVTAARDASLRGLRTLLLEARPRLGGRTNVADFAGRRIEVGGTWIGPGQPHVWAERMRYGLPIAESAGAAAEQCIWYSDGRRVTGLPADYWAMMTPACDAFYAPARSVFPRPYDPVFAEEARRLDAMSAAQAIDALELPATQRALLHSFAGINGHSPSSRSSYLDQLRWIALSGFSQSFMWDNLSRFRLAGGTSGLIERMMKDGSAALRLDTPVRSVAREGGLVQVATASGETFEGRAAVIALPLNLLAAIDFRPALSAVKIAASKRRHTGSGTKVYARVAGRHPIFFGHGPQELPLNFLWSEYADPDSQLLVGFGTTPERLDIADRAAVERAVRAYLPDASVTEAFGHDWTHDPYALGTWCMYPPGMLTGALAELQRPEGNLFFAGSDIANGWRGFIDGAIESGAVAAIQATNHLRRG